MLYLDKQSYSLHKTKPNSNYESFEPTLDIEEGFVLVAEVSTYDSFENTGTETHILDLYPTREEAINAVRVIFDRLKYENKNKLNDPEFDFFYANGKSYVRSHIPWEGWGTSLENLIINKVNVKEISDFMRYSRWDKF